MQMSLRAGGLHLKLSVNQLIFKKLHVIFSQFIVRLHNNIWCKFQCFKPDCHRFITF